MAAQVFPGTHEPPPPLPQRGAEGKPRPLGYHQVPPVLATPSIRAATRTLRCPSVIVIKPPQEGPRHDFAISPVSPRSPIRKTVLSCP